MINIFSFEFINHFSDISAMIVYSKIKNYKIENIINSFKKSDNSNMRFTYEDYIDLFSYGFKVIYGAIVKGIILILLACILKVLISTLVVTSSFGIVRIFSGGLHMKSYTKCTYISLTILLLGAFLGKNIPFYNLINIIVFIFTFIMFILFAPVENENRPLKDFEKFKFKIKAIIHLFVLFIIQLFLDLNIIKESIMFGVLLAGIITLPIVNKLK